MNGGGRNSLSSLAQLAAPILIGLILLALQFVIRDSPSVAKLSVPILSFVRVEVPLRSPLALRGLLFLLAAACFVFPALRDYSSFVPSTLRLEIFFDDEGLSRALSDLGVTALRVLHVTEDWYAEKEKYLSQLNERIEKILDHPFRFLAARGSVHSTGDLRIEVVRTKPLQHYRIKKLDGVLRHRQESPEEGVHELRSEFELLPTDANEITLTMKEIYVRHSKLICPELKQIIYVSAKERRYDHSLVAITRVRLFPLVEFGPSIYAVRLPSLNGHQLVPVAYAVYGD